MNKGESRYFEVTFVFKAFKPHIMGTIFPICDAIFVGDSLIITIWVIYDLTQQDDIAQSFLRWSTPVYISNLITVR